MTDTDPAAAFLAGCILGALAMRRARSVHDYVDGLVFTRPDGSPASPTSMRVMVKTWCAAAGLPRMRIHDLRHTALTIATETAGQEAARALAGHASIRTTDRYTHTTDGLLVAAARALEAIG